MAPPSIIVASSSSSRRSRINFGVDEIIVHPLERNQDHSLRSSQLQQPQAQSEVLTSCLKRSKMRNAKGIVKKLMIEQSEASSIIIKGRDSSQAGLALYYFDHSSNSEGYGSLDRAHRP